MELNGIYTPEKDSYWYGGKYEFTISIPDNYPFDPPKVMCLTKIYHPNIDMSGNVCLNILKDDWKPTLNVSTVIAGIYFLFTDPNPNDPLNHGKRNFF
jgi:ubiquitin-conjugating enzyme E2 M